ncbi:MAG: class I SAM-dependent methyltransferase [Selenomonas massiliensis]
MRYIMNRWNTFNFSKLGQYDLIVANDVLEHLVDPWSVVRVLKDHLSENGVFIAYNIIRC